MDLRTTDRPVTQTGGRVLVPLGGQRSPGTESPRARLNGEDRGGPWCLLALNDGSVWRGRSIGAPGPARGRIRAVGPLVLVEGETVAVLRDLEPVTDGADLWESLEGADGKPVEGFAGAIGATLPLHASVARAVACGEIGRP